MFLLVCFPIAVAFREFMVFFTQDPSWGAILSFVDAGAQRPLGRSALRALLAGGCLIGLLLPLGFDTAVKREKPWAGLFLLSGVVSVALSGRVGAAEPEWETWALILLFALLVRRARPKSIQVTALASLYLTCVVIFFHALWIAVPASAARLGGIFHHPNALSSFTVLVLPFLLYRARSGGLEGFGAAFLGGAILTLQLWAGSLTGACVLIFGLFFWLLRAQRRAVRWGLSLLGMSFPVAMNLIGGYPATLGYVVLLLALLTACCWNLNSRYFRVTLLFLFSVVLCSGVFTALAPTELSGRIISDRSNSAQARLHFYRAAAFLAAESPVVGQGPAAFPHEYPRYQGSIQFFSRFVHSIPLEVLMELGLLGFLCLAAMLFHNIPASGRGEAGVAFRCAFVAFGFHCLSGVQTQFPYLLILPVVAWAVMEREDERRERGRFWLATSCRLLLSVALLVALSLNFTRMEAAVDHSLAGQLYQSGGERSRALAHRLFQASIELEPGNGSYLLTYAQVQLGEDRLMEAAALAAAAIHTDPSWAAPRRVALSAGGQLSSSEVEEALARDPVNYPDLYRMKAELLAADGATEAALELLRKQAEGYQPLDLNRLPDFRAEDLEEQLVPYWLLMAVLEERQGRLREAEAAFRKSLFFTRRLLPRYRRLVSYAEQSGLAPGPVVGEFLSQLRNQLPAK